MLSVTAYVWIWGSKTGEPGGSSLWGWAAGLLGVTTAAFGIRPAIASAIGAILGVLIAYCGTYLLSGAGFSPSAATVLAYHATLMVLAYFLGGAVLGFLFGFLSGWRNSG